MKLKKFVRPAILIGLLLLYSFLILSTLSNTIFNRNIGRDIKSLDEFAKTGSTFDPLKNKTLVNITASSESVDLTLNSIKMTDFVEQYCYFPYEVLDKQFLIMEIKIKNKINSRYYIYPEDFYVIDNESGQHQVDFAGLGYIDEPLLTSVEANSEEVGNIVFALPTNITPIKFVYTDVEGKNITLP